MEDEPRHSNRSQVRTADDGPQQGPERPVGEDDVLARPRTGVGGMVDAPDPGGIEALDDRRERVRPEADHEQSPDQPSGAAPEGAAPVLGHGEVLTGHSSASSLEPQVSSGG